MSSFARGVLAAGQRRLSTGVRSVVRPVISSLSLYPQFSATNYTIDRFYTLGAAMSNSGWFAHLSCHGLQNPPAMGGASSPIICPSFWRFSLWFTPFHRLCRTPCSSPSPKAFGSALSGSAQIFVMPWLPARRGLLLATLCAMNGVHLATLGFPHIQGCSTLFSCANGPGEFEMPHTDGNRPVIADWWFPRRGAV